MVGKWPDFDRASIPSEFRRKLSREKLNKLIFQILRVLGKALKDRITPKWSLVAPAASKLILGGARFLPQKNESHRNPEKWKMETWTSQNDEKTRTHKSLILFSFMSVFILAQTMLICRHRYCKSPLRNPWSRAVIRWCSSAKSGYQASFGWRVLRQHMLLRM